MQKCAVAFLLHITFCVLTCQIFSTEQLPDRSDLPARTMLTSEGSVSRSTYVVADPRTQYLRTLTPIECERLNGIPDDWTAGMPERLRYFTMGNALAVPLVKAMGKRISALAEDEQRS